MLSRLLTLYICTGLAFMLLAGNFLGVWNLITISAHSLNSNGVISMGKRTDMLRFLAGLELSILGIGFYTIPKLCRLNSFGLSAV